MKITITENKLAHNEFICSKCSRRMTINTGENFITIEHTYTNEILCPACARERISTSILLVDLQLKKRAGSKTRFEMIQ